MSTLKRRAVTYLRQLADNLDQNTCELSEEELQELLRVIAHQPMTKAQACRYLNMSRSTFDSKVRTGELPKGRKILGSKELKWYKDELDNIVEEKRVLL